MSDPMKQAWNDVAEGFSTLGHMVKDRYQGAAPEPAEEPAPPADRGVPDAFVALRDAFDHLVAAGRELGDRAAEIAKDDDLKAQAKRAATTLNDALAATVDMIGHEVSGFFSRPRGDEPPPAAIDADEMAAEGVPADEVPTDEAPTDEMRTEDTGP
jgi:hypothetical protein